MVDVGTARGQAHSGAQQGREQLQIEKIAQRLARQRAGRCGRVSDGIRFRLMTRMTSTSGPITPIRRSWRLRWRR